MTINDRSKLTIPVYFLDKFTKSLPKGSKVLDAGCGTGYVSKLLIERGFDVISIDKNKRRIEKGKELGRFEDARICDVRNTNFPDQNFDGIISVELIEHLETPDSFLNESNRLLKENGLLAIKTPNKLTHDLYQILVNGKFKLLKGGRMNNHSSVMSPHQLKNKLKKHGFEASMIKSQRLHKNQIEKLGALGKVASIINFNFLPQNLQPSLMALAGKCDKV